MNYLMTMPTQSELETIRECAKLAKETGHYKKLMASGGEGAILLLLLTARELGIPPMAALNGGLQIVDGKVEMSAHMKTMKIRQAGHHLSVEYNQAGDTCIITGKRSDNGDTATISYSLKDAAKAGLTNRQNWQKHPKEMLYARCVSRISNILFPDAIGGVTYAKGEIDPDRYEEADIEEIEKLPHTVPDKKIELVHEEKLEDELEIKVAKLYDLFPNQDDLFAKFVIEKADSAKMPVDQMYENLYKNIHLVPERFEAWKNDKIEVVNG